MAPFKSHEPKRLVGLVTGAGELNSLAWPAPHRGLVTKATREYERGGKAYDKTPTFQSKTPISWVRLARNRIAFRHDERRGPPSHTLIHAVY